MLVAGKEERRALAAHEHREVAFDLADPEALGLVVRARLEKAGPTGPELAPRTSAQREVE
jgi:hypothetical protein